MAIRTFENIRRDGHSPAVAPIAGLKGGMDSFQQKGFANLAVPSADPMAEGPPIKFKGGRIVAISAVGERVIAKGKGSNGKKKRKPAPRSRTRRVAS